MSRFYLVPSWNNFPSTNANTNIQPYSSRNESGVFYPGSTYDSQQLRQDFDSAAVDPDIRVRKTFFEGVINKPSFFSSNLFVRYARHALADRALGNDSHRDWIRAVIELGNRNDNNTRLIISGILVSFHVVNPLCGDKILSALNVWGMYHSGIAEMHSALSARSFGIQPDMNIWNSLSNQSASNRYLP